MSKPLYISILLLLLAANALAANNADVNVQVVDSISGEPVEFACISNQTHTIGFMADADGRFSLPAQVAANDSIVISRIGYTQAIFRAAGQPIFEDGRERIIGTDQWKSIDTVPGIEIEIEY